MPATPVFALTYPSPDDPGGDFPAALADLAGDVEAALDGLVADTGVLTLPVTLAAGWALVTSQYRAANKILSFYLRVTRSGADIVATAAGNIADTQVATLTDAATRPAFAHWAGTFRASFTGGGALIAGATGIVQITSAHSTSTIATSDTVIIAGDYSIL